MAAAVNIEEAKRTLEEMCRESERGWRGKSRHTHARLLCVRASHLLLTLNIPSPTASTTVTIEQTGHNIFANIFAQINRILRSIESSPESLQSPDLLEEIKGLHINTKLLADCVDEEVDIVSVLSSSPGPRSSSSRSSGHTSGTGLPTSSDTSGRTQVTGTSASQAISAIASRVPVIETATFSSDIALMKLRKELLRQMADPGGLQLLFDSSRSILARSDEMQELFQLMVDSWAGSATRRSSGLENDSATSRIAHAKASEFPTVRMLADIYAGWYSPDCLRVARSPNDFSIIGHRLARCWTCYLAFPYKVDKLIWAEMIQIIISFLAHAVHHGAEAAISVLPLNLLTNQSLADADARKAVLEFAHTLWQEAFEAFLLLRCVHDAFAMTTTMILLSFSSVPATQISTNQQVQVYLEQLELLAKNMELEHERCAFSIRAQQLRPTIAICFPFLMFCLLHEADWQEPHTQNSRKHLLQHPRKPCGPTLRRSPRKHSHPGRPAECIHRHRCCINISSSPGGRSTLVLS